MENEREKIMVEIFGILICELNLDVGSHYTLDRLVLHRNSSLHLSKFSHFVKIIDEVFLETAKNCLIDNIRTFAEEFGVLFLLKGV